MSIDWITVSAQIVNFLVLVWLLKHFLYQPVILAMERREQRIADRLNEAEQREQQAAQQRQQYQDRQRELAEQREAMLDEAHAQTEQQKRQLLHEAREEVARLREDWQAQVRQEQKEFLQQLREETSTTIQEIARKALADLADSPLEAQVIEGFIHRLKSLDKEDRQSLAATAGPIRISSAQALDAPLRGRLTRAVHDHLTDDVAVEYSQSPALLCGIELSRGEQRLGWNLAAYLEQLGTRMQDAFAPLDAARD